MTVVLVLDARHAQRVGFSPTIDPRRGLVFVGIEYGAAGGILAAIEAASGRLVWKLETSNYVHSSPWFDADRDLVIVGSNDGRLYAADAATGVERWHFETGGEIKGRPMVDGDGRCFAGSFDGYLYALDAASGRLEWKRRLGYRVFADPLVHGDLVIAGGHSWRVVGIERATGSVRWVATTGGRILGGAARVTDSSVAIGSADGYVYLIDAQTGAVTWRYKTDGPIRSRPALADGLLVIPSCGGPLYAFSV